jgi:hypothetical protein
LAEGLGASPLSAFAQVQVGWLIDDNRRPFFHFPRRGGGTDSFDSENSKSQKRKILAHSLTTTVCIIKIKPGLAECDDVMTHALCNTRHTSKQLDT